MAWAIAACLVRHTLFERDIVRKIDLAFVWPEHLAA